MLKAAATAATQQTLASAQGPAGLPNGFLRTAPAGAQAAAPDAAQQSVMATPVLTEAVQATGELQLRDPLLL